MLQIKNPNFTLFFSIFFMVTLLTSHFEIQSQDIKTGKFNYISPVPDSKYNLPASQIIVRHGDPIASESIKNIRFIVNGEKSGEQIGEIFLSDDFRTLIFKPTFPFSLGEKIFVTISSGLRTTSEIEIEPLTFKFEVVEKIIQMPQEYYEKNFSVRNLFPFQNIEIPSNNRIEKKDNNLPEDFPGIQVNILDDNVSNIIRFGNIW